MPGTRTEFSRYCDCSGRGDLAPVQRAGGAFVDVEFARGIIDVPAFFQRLVLAGRRAAAGYLAMAIVPDPARQAAIADLQTGSHRGGA